MKTPKRPRDSNQLAHLIVGLITGQISEPINPENKNYTDRSSKGGKARAKSLTAHKRKEIAQKAAKKRWGQ